MSRVAELRVQSVVVVPSSKASLGKLFLCWSLHKNLFVNSTNNWRRFQRPIGQQQIVIIIIMTGNQSLYYEDYNRSKSEVDETINVFILILIELMESCIFFGCCCWCGARSNRTRTATVHWSVNDIDDGADDVDNRWAALQLQLALKSFGWKVFKFYTTPKWRSW